jgi:hypothetical protein
VKVFVEISHLAASLDRHAFADAIGAARASAAKCCRCSAN